MDKDSEIQGEEFVQRGGIIHRLLFHSYSVYLFSVILGVVFDMFINYKLFSNQGFQYIGFGGIMIGSIVVYWAQSTSGNYREEKAKLKNRTYFDRGPYRYMRTPTHTGLFIMTFGLALLINSLFSIAFTVLAHVVTKFFFIRKQEKILESKYGDVYTEYKKKVKNWL